MEVSKKRQIIVGISMFIGLILIWFLFSMLNVNNQQTTEKEGGGPISKCIYELPVTSVDGPYTIEYDSTEDNIDTVRILDSSPKGREAALGWLSSHGCDVGKLNILFEDFKDPLIDSSENERND